MPSSLAIVQKFYPDVKKVVNAKTDLNINLRPSDANTAKAQKHDGCAMAVACKRQCKVDGAIVSTTAAYLVAGNKATRYFVPASVAREILAFDRGAGFTPGQYELQKPYPKRLQSGRVKARVTGEKPQRRKALRSKGLRAALSAI